MPPSAFLAGVEFTDRGPAARRTARPVSAGHSPGQSPEQSIAELHQLATSAGATVVGTMMQCRPKPEAATLLGAGKAQELAAAAAAAHADLVLFDQELTATQQRNLESLLGCRVLARTQLILDIFARHARTREGQTQVELAQLEYLLPRLAGRGHTMSRLGGGIGTRGPGETQLETDRRRIHARIRDLRLQLEKIRSQRGQQRRLRESIPLHTVALVGYTNAGKSTLFNRLSGADVLTSARMFATLDPTIRAIRTSPRRTVLLSDTVGFLRDLPLGLITAFRATLEEVTRARLLLVVSDASSPQRELHEEQVHQVLASLDVAHVPRLRVWNKCDLLTALPRAADGPAPLLVSARTGEGVPALLHAMENALPSDPLEEVRLRLPHPAGALLHWLHEHAEILAENHGPKRVDVVARLPVSRRAQLDALRSR